MQDTDVVVSPYAQAPLRVVFRAGESGEWQIEEIRAVIGDGINRATRLAVEKINLDSSPPSANIAWELRGFTSNLRYTTRTEIQMMAPLTSGLGRPQARRAVLIPIRKSPGWWALPQDERRTIYEERSRHTSIGMEYMPKIARRLHHCRDLGEPFDFLTWFEFAPDHQRDFDELLERLRATEEWTYVDREVEIRLCS